jgi:hypothetical protein
MIMKSTAMKSLTVSFFATVGLTVGLGQSAQAAVALLPGFCTANCVNTTAKADPMLVKFDENGNATIAINGGPTMKLTGSLGQDPSDPNGGGEPVLIYKLPLQVISGDAIFTESLRVWSDVLRFTDNTGAIGGNVTKAGSTIMIYYSEFEKGELNTDLADTGFPSNAGTGDKVFRPEVGPENNNGFNYMPGGVPYPGNNQYIGISDAVPEFSTWGMVALGFAGLGFAGYRKSRNRMALSY